MDEKVVFINGGTYPVSMEKAVREDLKRAEEAQRAAVKRVEEEAAKYPRGMCPVKILKGSYHTECEKNCAFIHDYKCVFTNLDTGEAIETAGKKCCITSRECGEYCELYKNGCVIVKALKGLNKEY